MFTKLHLFIGYQWGKTMQRITALEAQSPKRHTMSTVAGLEDAMAVIIDCQRQFNAFDERLNAELSILQTLRSGPHNYDPDRSAGKRPEEW